jgi:hypothetical protein
MKLQEYRLIFIVTSLIIVLLIASPVLAEIIHFPTAEPYSELYLLGAGRMLESYPTNVSIGESHTVFLGVNNHMSSSGYYKIYVKLKNGTDLYPNIAAGTPSPLEPIHAYSFLLENNGNWEHPLTFSFNTMTISFNQLTIGSIKINNSTINVNKPSEWNSTTHIASYQLFFELWIYDKQSHTMQFGSRFVALQLNCTTNSI